MAKFARGAHLQKQLQTALILIRESAFDQFNLMALLTTGTI
jgi:hypothetical protein